VIVAAAGAGTFAIAVALAFVVAARLVHAGLQASPSLVTASTSARVAAVHVSAFVVAGGVAVAMPSAAVWNSGIAAHVSAVRLGPLSACHRGANASWNLLSSGDMSSCSPS
jgi:hypothetical protein